MSKFAYFNPQDGRVLQWIDTEAMAYNLPAESFLHACTDDEWARRDSGDWAVDDRRLVPYVTPETPADPRPAIRDQIAELEASVTPRRWREAVLTGDHSFVDSVDKQIAALRAAL